MARDCAPHIDFPVPCVPGDPRAGDERHLLDRLASGDQQAFWRLWDAHRRELFLVCYSQVGRRHEDAEDALSDVMQRAREALPREARRVENLSAWLRRMAVNLCTDRYRRDKRRCEGAYAIGADGAASQELSTRRSECPETAFLASEIHLVAARTIGRLPPRLRTASQLFFLWDAPYDGIAAELKISEPNARKRIQEARRILKLELGGYAGGALRATSAKRR